MKHGDCSPWWGCNGRTETAAAVVADDLGWGQRRRPTWSRGSMNRATHRHRHFARPNHRSRAFLFLSTNPNSFWLHKVLILFWRRRWWQQGGKEVSKLHKKKKVHAKPSLKYPGVPMHLLPFFFTLSCNCLKLVVTWHSLIILF